MFTLANKSVTYLCVSFLPSTILSSHSAAMPACNLHFGLLCLRNALGLIPENLTNVVNNEKDQKENVENDQNNHEYVV